MLIPKSVLVQATELTVADIKEALVNNGYFDNDGIIRADFAGQNPGGAYVYRVLFPDEDQELDDDDNEAGFAVGNIYVKINRYPVSERFEFVAEY